jgi:excisionase family DNA binding protein
MESEYLPVKKPGRHSKNDEERQLAEALTRYTTPSSESYDADFAAEISSIQRLWTALPTNEASMGPELVERCLNIKEVCKRLSASSSLVRRIIYDGTLPARRIGRRVIVLESDLIKYMHSLPLVVDN